MTCAALFAAWVLFSLLFTPSGDDMSRIYYGRYDWFGIFSLIPKQYVHTNGRVIGNFISFALMEPILGTCIMFASPVYHNVVEGVDTYRTVPESKTDFFSQIYKNMRKLGPYVLAKPWILSGVLFVSVLLLLKKRAIGSYGPVYLQAPSRCSYRLIPRICLPWGWISSRFVRSWAFLSSIFPSPCFYCCACGRYCRKNPGFRLL